MRRRELNKGYSTDRTFNASHQLKKHFFFKKKSFILLIKIAKLVFRSQLCYQLTFEINLICNSQADYHALRSFFISQ